MIRVLRGWLGTLDESDHPLVVCVLLLCCFGTLMVFAAGSYSPDAPSGAVASHHYLVKHVIRLGLGLSALVLFSRWDYRFFGRPLVRRGLLAVGLLLVALPVIAGDRDINRWFSFFGLFPVQPLELAKIAAVFYLAAQLARRTGATPAAPRTLLGALIVGPGALVLVLVLQPNFGNALVIGITTLVLLFAAGLSWRPLTGLLGLLAAGAVAGYFVVSKLSHRIDAWWRGLLADDYVYQVQQSLTGMGAGGWHGLGLGNSHNKFAFLPESHTDFVFAVLGEELGLLGTVTAVALFTVFAWRGIGIAERAADSFGRLTALGLTALIFVYAAANMAMATGLFPVMGVPLPFISYGGSALVTNLAAVGVLLNIDRQGRAHQEWRQRWQRY